MKKFGSSLEDCGKNIMKIAKIIMYIIAALGVIAGIGFMGVNPFIGIAVIVVFLLLAPLVTITLYAFGQLVDDVHEMRQKYVDENNMRANVNQFSNQSYYNPTRTNDENSQI